MDIRKLPLVSVVCVGLSISVYVIAVDDFTVRNKRQTYSSRSLSNYGSNINRASTSTGNTGYHSSGTNANQSSGNTGYSNQARSGNTGYGNQASSGNTGYSNQASSGNTGYGNQASSGNTGYSNQASSGNTGYGNQASSGNTGYGNQASSSNTNTYPRQYSGSQTQSGYQGNGAYIDLSGTSSSGSNMGSGSSATNMENYGLNTGTFLPGDTEYAYGVAGRTFGTSYITEALGYGYRQGVDANGKNVGYTAIGYLGVLSGK